ncbi:Alcohol dehydrogenase transcription factor Myb/SANT-like [Popillia japonica]|uniref:Alcohol dehydrogenase transcription factor Myb/SANT-like n=1 Tax=Popillia japonica TaxID=7064 RepID=A0AAW1LVF3_POPJA
MSSSAKTDSRLCTVEGYRYCGYRKRNLFVYYLELVSYINMPKKWGADITKRLVLLYELQPVLYKQNLRSYHNQLLRHKALEAIKEDLQCTFKEQCSIEEILKKINNLRSQFLEVTKKKKVIPPSGSVIPPSGSGAEDCVKPNWWLYDSLTFLLPYTKKLKGESNLNVPSSQKLLPNTQETTVEIIDLEAVSTDDDQYENVTEVIVQTDSLSPVSFIADSESSHTRSLFTNSDNNCESTSKTKKRRKSGKVRQRQRREGNLVW